MDSAILTEAFKKLDILDEAAFDLNSDSEIDDARDFLTDITIDDSIDIIDPDAESEDEVGESFIGKVILECNVCHSKIFEDEEDISIDEESNAVNVGTECPYCFSVDGYSIIGQVAPMGQVRDELEVEEEETVEEDPIDEKQLGEALRKYRKRKLRESRKSRKRLQEASGANADYLMYCLKNKLISPKDVLMTLIKSADETAVEDTLLALGLKDKMDETLREARRTNESRKVSKGRKRLTEAPTVTIPDDQLNDPDSINLRGLAKGAVEKENQEKAEKAEAERRAQLAEKAKDLLAEIKADTGSEDTINAVFHACVPSSGKSDNLAGELARAMERISYRDFNDGDVFYDGYGLETCGEAAAFIMTHVPEFSDAFLSIAERALMDDSYTDAINNIREELGQYILSNTHLLAEPTGDMFEDYDEGMLAEIKDSLPRETYDVDTSGEYIERLIESGAISYDDIEEWIEDILGNCVEYGSDAYVNRWAHDAFEIRDLTPSEYRIVEDEFDETFYRWVEEAYKEHEDEIEKYFNGEEDDDLDESMKKGKCKNDALTEGEEVCPECGKNPCECSGELDEDFKDVSITTDDTHMEMTSDENGRITVTSEPVNNEDDFGDGEMLAPVDIETKNNLMAEFEPEEGEEEVDVDFDEFDEEGFDELGESYLKKIYENVNSFKTSKVREQGNGLKIEGLIKFSSGNTKKTSFLFEAKDIDRKGKIRLIGENKEITRGKKAFIITGSMKDKKFMCESLRYNYRAKDENGKSTRLYGTMKRSK